MSDFGAKIVNEASHAIVKALVVGVSTDIRTGDPAEQIVKFAKENQVDLIVMGSRRLEGVSKIVVALGSVARKISERAFCPVMLVH